MRVPRQFREAGSIRQSWRAADPKNATAPWPRPRCPQTAHRCAWRHAILFRMVTPTSGQSDGLNAVSGHSESRYLHTTFAVLGLQDQPSITGEPVPSDSLLTHDKVSLSLVTNEEKRGHRDAAPHLRAGCRIGRD